MTDPTARPPALFVSEPAFLDPLRSGGVQRCSVEYAALLEAAGFAVHLHAVSSTRALEPRLKARAGIEAYDLYPASLARGVLDALDRTGATLVALNQVYLLPVVPEIRRARPDVRIVVLSHGNESGDFLHEALRTPRSAWQRARDQVRLGQMVYREGVGFLDVDAVLCLSETERHINLWLGAREALVVPRTWTPDFLDWAPVAGRVGFVGALDHLPNTEGIGPVLDALAQADAAGVEVRIVGGGGTGERLARRFSGATYLGRLSDAELETEVATWSLFLNPVWWYARGASTKLAQAIGWGLPIATSVPGMRGYEWSDGDLLVTETPEAMAAAAVQVAADPGRAVTLAAAVHRIAHSGPTLAEIADRVWPALTGTSTPLAERLRWPEPLPSRE